MTDNSFARGRGNDGGGSNRGGRSRQKGGRAERRRRSSADHIERLVDRLKAVRNSNSMITPTMIMLSGENTEFNALRRRQMGRLNNTDARWLSPPFLEDPVQHN